MKRNTITLISNQHNLRAEGSANKLRVLRLRDRIQERSYRSTVLRVQVGVDLVKDDKGAGLGCLEGKDQAQGAQTY